MADLTQDASLHFLGEAHVQKFGMDSSSAQTIYRGQPLIFNATDTSHAVGFIDSITVASTDVFIGIAVEGKVVASGDPETNEIEVYVGPSIIGFKSTVFTDANLGDTVYMSDSATLSATVGDNPQLGKLFKVEDGYCYVLLTAPQICTGA